MEQKIQGHCLGGFGKMKKKKKFWFNNQNFVDTKVHGYKPFLPCGIDY